MMKNVPWKLLSSSNCFDASIETRVSQRDVVYLGPTNSALVFEPVYVEGEGGIAVPHPMSTAVHMEPK